jgi:hypothetical protein
MSPTVTYWLIIAALCFFFPPLMGFVLGVAVFCAIWWFWTTVLVG